MTHSKRMDCYSRRRYKCCACGNAFFARAYEFLEEFLTAEDLEWLERLVREVNARKDESVNVADPAGQVYLIGAEGGYFKIGRSKNAKRRFQQITIGLPFRFELLHVIDAANAVAFERELHERYAEKRCAGEWFKLDEEDVVYVLSLGGVPR